MSFLHPRCTARGVIDFTGHPVTLCEFRFDSALALSRLNRQIVKGEGEELLFPIPKPGCHTCLGGRDVVLHKVFVYSEISVK